MTSAVIGAAIAVHQSLGPGLLEQAYASCLAHELGLRGVTYQREVQVGLRYKELVVPNAYRADFVVEGVAVVEIKAVEALANAHHAQLLTYMRLGGWRRGLLLNFWAGLMKEGITRYVL